MSSDTLEPNIPEPVACEPVSVDPVVLEPVTVAILAKAPIPGTVKTRLMFMLGVDAATTLHERFVHRAVETALAAAVGPVKLWASPDERHPLFQALAAEHPLTLLRQPEGDLGVRLLAAMLQAARPTIVIGTDCPLLTPAHLRDAAEALRGGSDAVLYPTLDGDFGLIGLRRPEPALFADWRGGAGALAPMLRHRLTQLDLSWREPGQLQEVDRPSDLRRLRHDGPADLLAGIVSDAKAPLLPKVG